MPGPIQDAAIFEDGAKGNQSDTALDDSGIRLPTYLPTFGRGYSKDDPLVYLDCVRAIAESMRKSRLLLFQIAKKERSILKSLTSSLKLTSFALQIDQSLAAFLAEDVMRGQFGGLSNRDPKELYSLVAKDAIIIAENGKAKASLLQLDKSFRDTIVDPLKNALIHRSSLDYESLFSKVKTAQDDIGLVLSDLSRTIGRVKSEITETLRRTKIHNKLLTSFKGEIVDVIYSETKGKWHYHCVVFVKLADGKTFTEGQKEEAKEQVQSLLESNSGRSTIDLNYVDQCLDIPVDENGNKVEAAVKQIVFSLPEDPNIKVANPECLEWYRKWIATHPIVDTTPYWRRGP